MNMLDLGPPLLAAMVLAVAALQFRKRRSAAAAVAGPAGRSKHDDMTVDDKAVDEDAGKPVVKCLFGSQTGTAEGFAKDLADDLSKAGFKTEVIDLEDFDPNDFDPANGEEFHLYLMATYGEGEPTQNAIEFMSFLQKGPDEGGPAAGAAKNIVYSVFGLGNTQYEHYNKIGRDVFDRLGALGGTAAFELGLGDDDQDIEEDFANWREEVVPAFIAKAFGANSAEAEASREPHPEADEASFTFKYMARFVPTPENLAVRSTEGRVNNAHGGSVSGEVADLSSRHLFQGVRVNVVENRELRQASEANGGTGSTVHVEFDLSGTGLKYRTADNLTVCAENDPDQVELAARILGLDLDQWFVVEPAHPEDHLKQLFPTPCSVRAALSYFTDLNGAPTRSLLAKLACFVTIPEHRERLRFLASKEGKADFGRSVTGRQLSVVEVFETFPSFKLTESNLGGFFEAMPRLKGREFTIASSSQLLPDRIALTVGVVRSVKHGEGSNRILNGVCSTYLQSLRAGSGDSKGSAFVFVKESSFKLPADPKTPILLIGPGTGIAPMRAFLHERRYQKEVLGQEIGDTVLFFGCRREDEDFLYKDELLEAVQAGHLSALHTAFSRQQADKVYVQHVMRERATEVWNLIERGAHVYVCGATEMGKDVHHALVDICVSAGKMGDEQTAKSFVQRLQTQGRYVQELWSS